VAGVAVAVWVTPSYPQAVAGPTLEVGGYLRSISGVQDLGYDSPLAERRFAFNGEVFRLKWTATLSEHVRLTAHNRVQLQLSSTPQMFGSGIAGFGVSVVPGRTVSLETTLLEEERFRVWHDLDRVAIDVYTGAVDLTFGRQAVSWGISTLFPIADLWAQFSPFELDTEERRGIDAARALVYPVQGLELDVVLADRGTLRDLSGGARATVDLPWADVYVAAGKFWRQVIGLAGLSAVTGNWKLRGEVALPWEIDAAEVRPIRATVGADRLGAKFLLSIEYHHNGLGATDASDYVATLQSAQLQRGETYFVGRHYLGALGSYQPGVRLALSVSALGNLQDPSVAFFPAASYDMGQSTRLSLGALLGAGEAPLLFPPDPELRSEFGAYGRLGYVTVSVYF
jgi:hypothetical protein